VQADDYYPFGLTLAGTAYERLGSQENRFKYNGKELQDDLGLDTYAYEFRMYDPAVGRWWHPDIIHKFHESPYAWVTNNPILYNDLLGLDSVDYNNLDMDNYNPDEDVVILPEVVINEENDDSENPLYIIYGDKVLPPRDGVWWVNAFRGDREYEYWRVNDQGYVIGLVPITGTAPAPNVGKMGSYNMLKKLTKGYKSAIQAHHLIEVRHLKRLLMSTKNAPSVILTKANHAKLTKKLQKLLPYGKTYSKSQIIDAYKKAYKEKPEWIEAVINYLK
jgi:RHS repeat-associated protein